MEGAKGNAELNGVTAVLQDPAFLRASELCSLFLVPLALRAAINLKVIDILALAAQEDGNADDDAQPAALSVAEIVSRMSSRYGLKGASGHALERVLRLLASHGVLDVAHVHNDTKLNTISLTPKYALNSVSKYFVSQDAGGGREVKEGLTRSMQCPPPHSYEDVIEQDKDSPIRDKDSPIRATFAPMLAWLLHKANLGCWHHVEESIMDDSLAPFMRANGKSMYLYAQEDHIFGQQFNSAMACLSKGNVTSFLEAYHGFSGVSCLVDVGGGVGSFLHTIVSRYPHIQGINFDQPHVIANASYITGVKHVGGNMFDAIPNAEAILLKSVLHNWSDEDSIKILECCYGALPHGGKVILLERMLPNIVGPELTSRVAYHVDLVMFLGHQPGRERTQQELQNLTQAAGFGCMKLVCKFSDTCVLELHKN